MTALSLLHLEISLRSSTPLCTCAYVAKVKKPEARLSGENWSDLDEAELAVLELAGVTMAGG